MNKIDGNQLSQLQSQTKKTQNGAATKATTTQASGTEQAPATTDTVNISDTARQLSAMEHSMESQVFNQEKVSLIKQAVDDGTYKPNPQAIAQSMVRFDQ